MSTLSDRSDYKNENSYCMIITYRYYIFKKKMGKRSLYIKCRVGKGYVKLYKITVYEKRFC